MNHDFKNMTIKEMIEEMMKA
nr:hypothetical protein B11C_150012 [Bartonella sp. 1-1C]